MARAAAAIGGLFFVGFGLFAVVDPRGFYDSFATWPPYNVHFVHDIGAFQVGLGAVLLLAALAGRADALAAALVGVGVGAALHTVSRIVGRDLGGTPGTDIPLFTAMAVLLLAAGGLRWRHERGSAR